MRIPAHVPLAILVLGITANVFAQRPPAIHGVTGTIATEETIKDEHKAANKAAVAVKDGVDKLVPDAKGPLSDLKLGTTVVIRYDTIVTEGTVSKVDRGDSEIVVRYDGGKTETLKLVDNGAAGARSVEYYSDDARGKVKRYFRPKS